MTICISAICETGQGLVFATDKLITAGLLTAEFEHPGGKTYTLGSNCIGLAAGDALYSAELMQSCAESVGQVHSPTIEQVARTMQGQFSAMRLRRAEEIVLQPRGLTMTDFYQGGLVSRLPTELAFSIDQGIQNSRLTLQIMLAGLDASGAHIYSVDDPGTVDCYDRLGYHAVGSGETHALLVLIGREHATYNSLTKTVYLVFEAKKKAEVAPGVGRMTEMGYITRANGLRMLSDDVLRSLNDIYERIGTPQEGPLSEAMERLGLGDTGGGE